MRTFAVVFVTIFFSGVSLKAAPPLPPPDEHDYTIFLRSRTFLPPADPTGLLSGPLSGSSVERPHIFIQFYEHPTRLERRALEDAQIELLTFLPNYAWYASLPRDFPPGDPVLANARWLGLPELHDKISPHIRDGEPAPWPQDSQGRDAYVVQFHADSSLDDGETLILQHAGEIVARYEGIRTLYALFRASEVNGIASDDSVDWIDFGSPAMEALNDGSRVAINVDPVQAPPYNLSGQGIDILIEDIAEVWPDHPDFTLGVTTQSRVVVGETASTSVDHSTHVAGTAAGNGRQSGGQYRGMAPMAGIVTYNIAGFGPGGSFFTSPGDLEHDFTEAVILHGADLGSASLGSNLCKNVIPFVMPCQWEGDYTVTSQMVDQLTLNTGGRPFFNVWAAGNERLPTGDCLRRCGDYRTIGIPATAKNSVAVGAVDSDPPLPMSDFSSWGPMDDGRLKPDVVAAGCQAAGNFIWSTVPHPPQNFYGGFCGTSMATPAVAGASALLMEEYRIRHGGDDIDPSAMKALLIHDATDMGAVGPDFQFGWGLVNANVTAKDLFIQAPHVTNIGDLETDRYFLDLNPLTSGDLRATDPRLGRPGIPALPDRLSRKRPRSPGL